MPFDPARDLVPVALVASVPIVLVVPAASPVRSLAELIALARREPGRLAFGSSSVGGTNHLAGELLKAMAGIDIVHVPYRGAAPAMTDLVAGRLQLYFDNMPGVLPQLREGRVRAIAQARQGRVRALAAPSRERSPVVPDLPSLSEFFPGFHIVSWTCLTGPAGLPPAMVARMNALAKQALGSEELRRSYLEQGATPWWTTPEQIAAHRAAEQERLKPLILASGAVRN